MSLTDDNNDNVRKRELLRRERHNKRTRDRNLNRTNPEKMRYINILFLNGKRSTNKYESTSAKSEVIRVES